MHKDVIALVDVLFRLMVNYGIDTILTDRRGMKKLEISTNYWEEN